MLRAQADAQGGEKEVLLGLLTEQVIKQFQRKAALGLLGHGLFPIPFPIGHRWLKGIRTGVSCERDPIP
jgi:hypothetical protein